MKVKDICKELEKLAPLNLQEGYDNSGLISGDLNSEVEAVLISLDCTEEVVEEAIKKNCQMIVSHHPILFSGLKSLTGKNYIERTIIKAIKNDVAIYAIHTNLDNVERGVNRKIAEKIGLKNLKILSPKKELLNKLVFFVPMKDAEKVRSAIFEAGAGNIGNYDACSFNTQGTGTFRAGESANPYVGKKGEIHQEDEYRVEVILPNSISNGVISAMKNAHPYEEVAYDLYPLLNKWDSVGSGMVGVLDEEVDAIDFLKSIKKSMKTQSIRYTQPHKQKIKKVAVCGGSGSFLLNAAKASGADVFITADYKYHQFFDAEDEIIIADIGHFESEQFTPDLIKEYLEQIFTNFALYLSEVNTNPVNYI